MLSKGLDRSANPLTFTNINERQDISFRCRRRPQRFEVAKYNCATPPYATRMYAVARNHHASNASVIFGILFARWYDDLYD
jgi:hypothetical protein